MKSKEPKIGTYLDEEERELIEAIEGGAYNEGTSLLTPERKQELQEIARAHMNDEKEKITIRISRRDLLLLKTKAMQDGLPYQTLIGSILHKAVS